MSTAVIWSKSKPDVEYQYGGRFGEFYGMSSHSQPPATMQGAATWRIQCHDPKATCHIAGCCHRRMQRHVVPEPCITFGEFTVMIPEPHATLQNAVTWRNQCHDRATLQGVKIPSAILKIVFRHILFFFVFLMQFGL